MNPRVHYPMPPEFEIPPILLVDFPIESTEIPKRKTVDRTALLALEGLDADQVTQRLRADLRSHGNELATLLAESIVAERVVIGKEQVWVECVLHEPGGRGGTTTLLLTPPTSRALIAPIVEDGDDRGLFRTLSGLTEGYPPLGGGFQDMRRPARRFTLSSKEHFPPDARPGELIFTAANPDLIIRQDDGKYVWWTNACSRLVLIANDVDGFTRYVVNHFRNSWRAPDGMRVLWPLDGYGPPKE